jgi:cell division septation protein DedD
MAMIEDERGKPKSGPCEAVRGGYTIFLDEERMSSFFEAGDFSSSSELDKFRDVGAHVENRLAERPGASFLALSIGERGIARDFAALQIAHVLAQHGKNVLIVDCDFLHPGLSGLVENIEDQGFLDLLLYGSSLKTIAKPTGIEGVSVAGPGSFPVSRTIPFALKEFGKVQEFLRTKHDAVIYCSTLNTEDAKVNPLVTFADGIILACRIDEMAEGELEKSLKSIGTERVPPVELVCFCAQKKQPAAGTGAGAAPERKVLEPAGGYAKAVPLDVQAPAAARGAGPEALQRGGKTGLGVVRLVVVSLSFLIVAFVIWWIFVNRAAREEAPHERQSVAERREAAKLEPAATIPAESLSVERQAAIDTAGHGAGGMGSAGTAVATSGETAAAEMTRAPAEAGPARYVIHVSSFKEMSRAGDEKAYLEKSGFNVQIVEVTINGEHWLRVFVGPYVTMEEASKARLDLLGLPRIGYARIVDITRESR